MGKKLLNILMLTLMSIAAWGQAPAGVEAVDLNLPSGTMWANMNIGATSETDYGDYFAWGATSPYYSALSPLTWKTGYTVGYVETNAPFWDGSAWTKYNETDSKTALEAADDAVIANWGAPWQMPTYEEYVELIANTDHHWVSDYNSTGISGYKFINQQDNTKFIFLPAAGLIEGTDFPNKGTLGYYWLASLNSDVESAKIFYFSGTAFNSTIAPRYRGMTIRAIQHPNYLVTLKMGTDDASNWSISPNTGEENTLVTLRYSGTRHLKSVRAYEKIDNNPLLIPLTLEATADGAISITSAASGMQYTKNGGAKTAVPTSIPVSAGDVIQFYGTKTSVTSYSGTKIGCTVDCYIYGNIMSLVNETYFPTAKELSTTSVFAYLFQNNTHIINHDTKILVLPATTLSVSCYEGLFDGCTGLTVAPELPAETMNNYCYRFMFRKCSGLTTAPDLPAMELATQCYKSMFNNCTNLTAAPATLPATTLQTYCYESMFESCSKLTTSPILPAPTLTSYCYLYMFRGCSLLENVTCLATDHSAYNCTNNWLQGVKSSGTFYKASAASWTTGNATNVPSGWTQVNYVAP